MTMKGHRRCTEWHAAWILYSQHIMTVRVGTFDTILTGSPSRILPVFRMLSAAVMGRLSAWWQERSALVMSDEWLHEYRWSSRDRQ